MATPAAAQISQVAATTLASSPRWDVAHDNIHDVYLVITEGAGQPIYGQFLDRNAQPVGSPFEIAGDAGFIGWPTLSFGGTPQDPTFLVTYHNAVSLSPLLVPKYARLVRYQPGNAPLVSARSTIIDNLSTAANFGERNRTIWSGQNFIVTSRVPGPLGSDVVLHHVGLGGQVSGGGLLSDGLDYFGGPSLACAPSGACLATGYGQGYRIGQPTGIVWARMFDGNTLQPTSGFLYPDDHSSRMDTPMVTYVSHIGKFQTAWFRTGGPDPWPWGLIDFRQVDTNGVLGPLDLTKSFGAGAGEPRIAYNAFTKTTLLVSKQGGLADLYSIELDQNGYPIPNSFVYLTNWDGAPEYRPDLASSGKEGRWLLTFKLSQTNPARLIQGNSNGNPPPQPNDVDNDTVPDPFDQCPTTYGQTASGCPASPPPLPRPDVSGDSKADLIFQHGSGPLFAWHMDSWQTIGFSWLSQATLAPEWSLVAARDFTGDGQTDLVWHNAVTGDLKIWRMGGSFSEQTWSSNPGWTPMASGDFNGDGHADLVWEDVAGGRGYIWFMKPAGGQAGFAGVGGAFLGDFLRTPGGQIVFDPNLPTGWRIVGAGDFNADGRADLVAQHNTTGELQTWLLNGAQGIGVFSLTPRYVDPSWKIRSVADFSGDGHPDLVWRNETTGHLYIWIMNGFSMGVNGFLNSAIPVNIGWRLAGAK